MSATEILIAFAVLMTTTRNETEIRPDTLKTKPDFIIAAFNKCMADDTKAAARQSPNCILKKQPKIWRKTIFSMADRILTPCNVACGSGIMTGSILQCDTWLWDDMPLNSPIVSHIGILHLVSISAIIRSRHVILH